MATCCALRGNDCANCERAPLLLHRRAPPPPSRSLLLPALPSLPHPAEHRGLFPARSTASFSRHTHFSLDTCTWPHHSCIVGLHGTGAAGGCAGAIVSAGLGAVHVQRVWPAGEDPFAAGGGAGGDVPRCSIRLKDAVPARPGCVLPPPMFFF
ncbi:hypothetical protein B0H13DRAFT_2341366 [Mycena leptocephala]|nr:hypothetical protein B0H13DRAFT_2341366 [Mycena leptocephala]